jgi:hypothetical protein
MKSLLATSHLWNVALSDFKSLTRYIVTGSHAQTIKGALQGSYFIVRVFRVRDTHKALSYLSDGNDCSPLCLIKSKHQDVIHRLNKLTSSLI